MSKLVNASVNLLFGMKITKTMRRWTALCAMIIALGIGNNIKAQKIQINTSYVQGIHYTNNWDVYKGGAELSAEYLYPINDFTYSGGLAFRTVQWGTQLSVSLGAAKTWDDKFELGAKLQNGIALFYSRKLYVIGTGVKFSYIFFKREKMQMGTSIGLRYTACPAYKDYSKIHTLTEMPIGVFIRF